LNDNIFIFQFNCVNLFRFSVNHHFFTVSVLTYSSFFVLLFPDIVILNVNALQVKFVIFAEDVIQLVIGNFNSVFFLLVWVLSYQWIIRIHSNVFIFLNSALELLFLGVNYIGDFT